MVYWSNWEISILQENVGVLIEVVRTKTAKLEGGKLSLGGKSQGTLYTFCMKQITILSEDCRKLTMNLWRHSAYLLYAGMMLSSTRELSTWLGRSSRFTWRWRRRWCLSWRGCLRLKDMQKWWVHWCHRWCYYSSHESSSLAICTPLNVNAHCCLVFV